MKLCDYGCGQKAKYPPRKGMKKWCCSEFPCQCPKIKRKIGDAGKGRIGYWKDKKRPDHSKKLKGKTWELIHGEEKAGVLKQEKRKEISGKTWEELFGEEKSLEMRENQSLKFKGKTYEKLYGKVKAKKMKRKQSKAKKGKNAPSFLTIEKIKKKFPFFSQIEEMRYNPDKPEEKEIQIHCKNYECKNSKENGGWFTPFREQFKSRKEWLENKGKDICYFYCSQHCKDSCSLYQSKGGDPFKNTELPYTSEERQTLNQFVLERDNYICQFCGAPATDVHHERPVKLEPFFALDPYFAWSCCEKCHYEKGHRKGTECSTGNLANKIC